MPIGFLIIVLTAAARFLLVVNLPIRFLPYDLGEDGLFMRLAADRASAVWPGEFNQFILLKGPGYPLPRRHEHFGFTALSGSRLVSNCGDIGNGVDRIPCNQIAVGRYSDFRCSRFLPCGTGVASGIAGPDLLGSDAASILVVRDNHVCAAHRPFLCANCRRSDRIDLRVDFPYRRRRRLVSSGMRARNWRSRFAGPT